MYGRSRVKVKVEPHSTFPLTRGLSYIVSISFTLVNFTCVRTENYATTEINPWKNVRPIRTRKRVGFREIIDNTIETMDNYDFKRIECQSTSFFK